MRSQKLGRSSTAKVEEPDKDLARGLRRHGLILARDKDVVGAQVVVHDAMPVVEVVVVEVIVVMVVVVEVVVVMVVVVEVVVVMVVGGKLYPGEETRETEGWAIQHMIRRVGIDADNQCLWQAA